MWAYLIMFKQKNVREDFLRYNLIFYIMYIKIKTCKPKKWIEETFKCNKIIKKEMSNIKFRIIHHWVWEGNDWWATHEEIQLNRWNSIY